MCRSNAASFRSDAAGEINLENLQLGSCRVVAHYEGFADASITSAQLAARKSYGCRSRSLQPGTILPDGETATLACKGRLGWCAITVVDTGSGVSNIEAHARTITMEVKWCGF